MTALEYPAPTPSIIVFGRDNAGKPHASWFDQASVELATKAASIMNMHAVPIEGDGLRELAGTLPRGRIFSSGRAFTPFVSRKLYERLIEVTRDLLGLATNDNLGAEAHDDGKPADAKAVSESAPNVPSAPAGAPKPENGGKTAAVKRPTLPDEVGMGSMVLAYSDSDTAWYEAEVIGLNGAMLTLRWRDYSAEPTFVRRAHQLGFLPSAA